MEDAGGRGREWSTLPSVQQLFYLSELEFYLLWNDMARIPWAVGPLSEKMTHAVCECPQEWQCEQHAAHVAQNHGHLPFRHGGLGDELP